MRSGRVGRGVARACGGGGTAARDGLVAVAALTLLLATGCSGDGDDDAPSGDASAEVTQAPPVPMDAALGKVVGRLGDDRATAVLGRVTDVVGGWIVAGFAGEYPRTDFDAALDDFTDDARSAASRQLDLLTNAAVGAELSDVEVSESRVRVDVLAPKGRVAGATARVRLTLELVGEQTTTDVVEARLRLTPTDRGWRVFAFDVDRGREGA